MEHFSNDDLEYVLDDYYDVSDFEDENVFSDNVSQQSPASDSPDSDFEDDFETSNAKTDTSASEARNGKDIQGIPWERLNYSREEYRETRLKQYKNYENLSRSREHLDKECLEVQKGKTFYDFQFNTRLVKSTVAHFQKNAEASELPSKVVPPPRSSSKRSRAAEFHNLSEKRRSKINEKMKALQNLIPNSNKTDKASMLDEAIEYLKQLQLQVQIV